MALTTHPTVRRIIYILVFISIPSLIAIYYFWVAEGNYVEELITSVFIFFASGGICFFSYCADAEEIAFCEEHEVSSDTLNEIIASEDRSSFCGNGDSSGGSEV